MQFSEAQPGCGLTRKLVVENIKLVLVLKMSGLNYKLHRNDDKMYVCQG